MMAWAVNTIPFRSFDGGGAPSLLLTESAGVLPWLSPLAREHSYRQARCGCTHADQCSERALKGPGKRHVLFNDVRAASILGVTQQLETATKIQRHNFQFLLNFAAKNVFTPHPFVGLPSTA